jgi:hypothetical protein
MKIYLDTCIFQSLKSEEHKELLELIISGKGEYHYFFSEAHLLDLSRDETAEKLDDLRFMERIVGDNCLWFEARELFKNSTPTDCYQRFDWSGSGNAEDVDFHTGAFSAEMPEIKGFDGKVITDKALFIESLSTLTNQKDRNLLEQYLDLYNLLDLLKIVPGGHQKHQFINMINDAKHSFFGRNCEIVVTNDHDFIRKSSFLYDLFEIDTIILTMQEFETFLKEQVLGQTDVVDSLIAEIAKETVENSNFLKNQENGNLYFVEKLRRKYLGYFDEIIRSKEGSIFVTKNFDHAYFKRTLLKEMEHCANRLYARFGADINSTEKFDPLSVDAWGDKTWIVSDGELQITLLYDRKLFLVLDKVVKAGE